MLSVKRNIRIVMHEIYYSKRYQFFKRNVSMYLIWHADYASLSNNCVSTFVDLHYISLFLPFSSYIMHWIWPIDFHCHALPCVYISINDFTVSSVISLKTNCFEGMSERLMGTALHNGDVFIILQRGLWLSARKLRKIDQQYPWKHVSLSKGLIELFNFLAIYSAIRYCMIFNYS